MNTSDSATLDGRFAEELSELADGSISRFFILPRFRSMVVSDRRASDLQRFEALLEEYLAQLDGRLGDVLVRRDRSDGALTHVRFDELSRLGALPASTTRDTEIFAVVEQAQLFLMGSCSFSLQCARDAELARPANVLEDALARIGSMAVQSVASNVLRPAMFTSAEFAA